MESAEENMSPNKKLRKFYAYIFFIVITSLLINIINGINHNKTFSEVRLSNEKISKHNLVRELWNYVGTFIMAIIFNIYEDYTLRPESNERKSYNQNGKKFYIYNDSNGNNLSKCFFCCYFLIIFCWIIEDKLIESYTIILQDLDFWMIELFIITLLNLMFFHIFQIYKHHIFAISLSVIPSLLKIISICLSFIDECDYYNGGLPIYYKSNPWLLIPIGIIIYIILLSMRSLVNLTIKWYMDKKYISCNKILTLYGLIGMLFYIGVCSLTTFKYCKKTNKNADNVTICDYIAKVTQNVTNITFTEFYFDNFKIYFDDFEVITKKETLKEILIILIEVLSFFFNKYFSLKIIQFLSPMHVIFSVPIRYLLEKITSSIYTLCKENNIFATNDKYKMGKFILDSSGDIVSIFGFLIYLEIIELGCKKYHQDLMISIMRRGNQEAGDLLINDNTYSEDEV